ncbi:MAG: hypothetical protein AB7L13_22730 [Acidimicrobiia bacterium]
MKVRDIAYTRCGDKGDISNIGVFVYDDAHWDLLRERLTADKVQQYFQRVVHGPVVRYELPRIHGLNFLLHGALDGGGPASLVLDPVGKTYGSYMLDIDLDE